MNKNQARGAIVRFLLTAIACLSFAAQSCETTLQRSASYAENAGEGIHIALIADPHLPYKASKLKDAADGAARTAAKEAMRADINAWTDVQRLVVLGDIAGERGSSEEYAAALSFLAGFKAPLVPITGNHDFIYTDAYNAQGNIVRCAPEMRAKKLEYFKAAMGLDSLQREEKLGGYELVYLCADSLDKKHQVGLSPESLAWLDERLARNSSLPTIIFFHAPLEWTVIANGSRASGDSAAQPAAAIGAILAKHPQVFLWVSGHTHTKPSDPSFASPINLYDDRVMDIHCPDADRVDLYTNSLWLYPDHVLVRTYDHRKGAWLEALDRRVAAWGR
jgi:3',5'-cyclic AMP phosphodiesterase CpdA